MDVGTDPVAPADDYTDVDNYAVAHNYWNKYDVDNNGQVTALDALRVINFMNQNPEGESAGGDLGESVQYVGFVDVNGDHAVTALDALQVINRLNGGEGEEEFDVRFEITPRNLDNSELAEIGTYTTATGGSGVRYTVDEGDIFKLEVAVQDNRGRNAFGVFQAVTDVVVGQSGVLEPAVGEIQGFSLDRAILGEANNNTPPGGTIRFFYQNDPSDFVQVSITEFLGANDIAVSNFISQRVVEDLTSGVGELNITPADVRVTAGTTSTTSPYEIRIQYNSDDLIGIDVPRLQTVLTIDGVVQTNTVRIEENVRQTNGEYDENGPFNPNTLVGRYETFMRNHPSNASANNGQGPLIYGQNRNIGSFDTGINGTDIFDEVGTLGPVGNLTTLVSPFDSTVSYDAFSIPVRAVKPATNVGIRLEKVEPRDGFEGVLVYGTDNGKETVPLNRIRLDENSEFQLTVTGAATGITASNVTLPTLAEGELTATTVQTTVVAASGETPTYAIPTQGALGTATISATGLFSFTPGVNQFGTEVISYTATTATDGTATGQVTVTVSAVNDAPVANDDSGFSVDVGSSVLILVLANDDAGGNNTEPLSELTITAGPTAPTRGSIEIVGDQIRYTPTPGIASGTDTFSYTITDTGGLFSTANVTLDVVNNSVGISAGNKTIGIQEDNGGVTTSEVLVADLGADNLIVVNTGSSDIVLSAATAASGIVRIDGDQIFYTPVQNANGQVLITYTANNDLGSDTGIITVNIDPVNDRPIAPNLDFTVNERATRTINVLQPGGGQTAPSDVETATQNLIVTLAPGFSSNLGTVAVVNNLIVVNSTGTAAQGGFSFQYRVTDADGAVSDNGSISINVLDIQDPPIAQNSTRPAVDEGVQTITVDLAALTTIEGNDTVNYSIVTQGSVGTASISGNNLLFTLGADETGSNVEVVYRATGLNGSDDGTITFTVNPVNDAPILGAIADQSLQENSFVDIDVLAEASDPDGDAMTVEIVSQGTKGIATVNGGLVRYQTNTDELGADSIQVRVTDPSNAFSETRTINLNITDVVFAPVAGPGSLTAVEDGPNVTLDLRPLVNAQAGIVTFAITQPTGGSGTATVAGSVLTYDPNADSNGQTTLTYTATNALGNSTNTITINITATNDDPIAVNDSFSVIKDTATPLNVLANDTPNPAGENDTITVSVAAGDGPSLGSVSIDSNNVITYTPNSGATGNDSFTYTLSDGQGGVDTATVQITIEDFAPSSISGQLYLDSVSNISQVVLNGADPIRSGAYESGEVTLAGVRVHLRSVGGAQALATVVTDVSGNYTFDDVPPGNYEIVYNLPAGMQVSGEGVDGVIPVTIGAGGGATAVADFDIQSLGTTINVGRNVVSTQPGTEELPASITPGEISSVFFSQNASGVLIQDAMFVGRDFGDADFIELLINEDRDEALLVVVNDGNVESAVVRQDRFTLNPRSNGFDVQLFGGKNDFVFSDVDDITDITSTYPEYAAAIDELLSNL